jgi:glucuronate isomerase
MELKKYFGYDKPVIAANAAKIFAHCNEQIEQSDFCVHSLLQRSKVEWLATTDDPADSLTHHAAIKAAKNSAIPQVFPTFRPGILLECAWNASAPNAFSQYIERLSTAAQKASSGTAPTPVITDWDTLLLALEQRLDFFAAHGCVISDHSLEPPVFDESATEESAAQIFKAALRGEQISPQQAVTYKTKLLSWLGGQYKKRGWVMQLHMGAMRANNSQMMATVGADSGFDSMSDAPYAHALSRILDDMEKRDGLPRTILYGLNPTHDAMLATMIGNFQGKGIRGRVQWGAPWWFNDTKMGMEAHLTTLASLGMLAHFVGMLTDSRSFISYPRHDYFRRILANQMGKWVENGEFPRDIDLLNKIAGGIAYYNAKEYFSTAP